MFQPRIAAYQTFPVQVDVRRDGDDRSGSLAPSTPDEGGCDIASDTHNRPYTVPQYTVGRIVQWFRTASGPGVRCPAPSKRSSSPPHLGLNTIVSRPSSDPQPRKKADSKQSQPSCSAWVCGSPCRRETAQRMGMPIDQDGNPSAELESMQRTLLQLVWLYPYPRPL